MDLCNKKYKGEDVDEEIKMSSLKYYKFCNGLQGNSGQIFIIYT